MNYENEWKFLLSIQIREGKRQDNYYFWFKYSIFIPVLLNLFYFYLMQTKIQMFENVILIK